MRERRCFPIIIIFNASASRRPRNAASEMAQSSPAAGLFPRMHHADAFMVCAITFDVQSVVDWRPMKTTLYRTGKVRERVAGK